MTVEDSSGSAAAASDQQEAQSAVKAYLSPADYLRERVDDQLAWYGRKSASNKNWYYRLQLVTLLSAISIPVISLSSDDDRLRLLVALIGAIAALASGVLSMYQFRDQWLDYRSTAEALKFEKHLYLTRSAPYNGEDAFSLFVNRIENLILSENRNWREKSFTVDTTDEQPFETATRMDDRH